MIAERIEKNGHYRHVIMPVDSIFPFEKNSRKHSESQISQVTRSIQEFGFANPILIDENNIIIAGHARLIAAKKSGMTSVPCIVLDNLTDAQRRAYVIADNKLALNAEWDIDMLLSEVKLLQEENFEIELTGFTLDEISDITPDCVSTGLTGDDDVPDVPEEPVTKMGDIWILGNHRLMCGDATMIDDVEKLMADEIADMLFTDPPYGINYSGRGKNTSCKIENDDIDPSVFYNLVTEINERYIWGRIENYSHLLIKPRDVIIWKKNNFGMGSGYRGQYEACFYYGSFNGSDSDVWEIDRDVSYEHPTQKPVALAERAIKNSNPKKVIDLFGGSGSTLIACEKTNRKCLMMEISPQYCDVIIKRWEKFTGQKAVLNGNG